MALIFIGIPFVVRAVQPVLEKLDPSENYRGTALEGLDAFSRQLKRFDIKVKGRNSDLCKLSLEFKLCGTFPRICEQSRLCRAWRERIFSQILWQP